MNMTKDKKIDNSKRKSKSWKLRAKYDESLDNLIRKIATCKEKVRNRELFHRVIATGYTEGGGIKESKKNEVPFITFITQGPDFWSTDLKFIEKLAKDAGFYEISDWGASHFRDGDWQRLKVIVYFDISPKDGKLDEIIKEYEYKW